MNKGIVIAPKHKYDGKTLHLIGEADLKYYLLYWDEIDYPTNNLMYIKPSEDEKYLMELGILKKSNFKVNYYSGNVGPIFTLAQINIFEQKNMFEPGKWTLGQIGSDFDFYDKTAFKSSVDIKLYNMLPSPGENVSIDDILEFKIKRKDELIALRCALDQIYLNIINSKDSLCAESVEIRNLEQIIQNLHKVVDESWRSKYLTSLKLKVNISNLVKGSAYGAAIATSINLPKIPTIIGTTIISCISFEPSTNSVNIPDKLRDYAYLHSINNNLIRKY